LLDVPAKRLVYTNAGHNPPLLVRGDGDVIRLEAGGPVLGVVQDAAFEQGELELSAEDRLLLFTDGASEAANAEQEEFGEDRLTSLLRGSSAESAEALQSRIMREVTQFCANRFQDDATVVVLVVQAQARSAAGAA
jgi:sigma-B regulation protein RsbU (phosphoserine phosphatase)